MGNLPTVLGAGAGPVFVQHSLRRELTASLLDPNVWVAIGAAFLLGVVSLLLGIWIARRVGILDGGEPVGETLGVGLASGLVAVAALTAALGSGGQSSLTPIALALVIAALLGTRARGARGPAMPGPHPGSPAADQPSPGQPPRYAKAGAACLAAAFVVAVGLLYGSTLAPSPSANVQPVEYMDEAYYSVLSTQLAQSGTESIEYPSGFDQIVGLSPQTWYHWGELWLSAAIIKVRGTDPLLARHYGVLPLLLLAAMALTGTLVRRLARTDTTEAFLFGAVICLFLAPVPLLASGLASWARGLVFGITQYGLVAVVVPLAIYIVAVRGSRGSAWGTSLFCAAVMASLVPLHIVIALLAAVGAGAVFFVITVRSLVSEGRLPYLSAAWRNIGLATAGAVAASVAWGVATGHGLGATGESATVVPFSSSWLDAVSWTALGSGVFLAIPWAWLLVRKEPDVQRWLYLGCVFLTVLGAIVWGARLPNYNMFHFFFGAIAVFATPVVAIAGWTLWSRLKGKGYWGLGTVVLVVFAVQTSLGAATGIQRLKDFGPPAGEATPVSLLAAIRSLPPDAKLAYACQPSEEAAFWDPHLVSIYAHTGRRIVPMCFESDVLSATNGGSSSPTVPNPFFRWAPQRTLYPDAAAQPSVGSVTAFLKGNGIDYIYANKTHPNTLVPGAVPIAVSGDAQVLRVP